MKHNKFSKFIEHILVCLPLLFLGITSAYVVFNKNAKDSYNDYDYIIDSAVTTQDFNDLLPNSNAILHLVAMDDMANNTIGSQVVYFSDLTIGNDSYTRGRFQIGGLTGVTNGYWLGIFDFDSGTYIRRYSINDYAGDYNFYLISVGNADFYHANQMFDNSIGFISLISTQNTLDSVLPYAMGEFNKLGFGKIPFTSFFTSIFMNGETNVYVEFVNSYLNYFLFVEATYFLPMVIYWFIHFGERLVDKFSNKEF